MLNERQWIRQHKGDRYTVTEAGRKALLAHRQGSDLREKDVHVPQEDYAPARKYGVFISSTYRDLIDERQEVMQSVVELGNFPLGMELFGAASVPPWQIIESEIDMCDYYILVIGVRYGSLVPEKQISYTEQEFDYAMSQKKPVLAFVINDRAMSSEYQERMQHDAAAQLKSFREKVQSCELTVQEWSNRHELGKWVSKSLIAEILRNPQPGWVRGAVNLHNNENAKEQNAPATSAVLLSYRLRYRDTNLKPNLPQFQFAIEVCATNKQVNAIKEYSLDVSVPSDIESVHTHFDQLTRDNGVTTIHRNETNKPLLNGQMKVVASIDCIIAKHNQEQENEITSGSLKVNFYADGIDSIEQIIPMSTINPFQIKELVPRYTEGAEALKDRFIHIETNN